MRTAKIVVLLIVGLALVIVLAFGLELGGLKWRKYFKPKYAEIEREVFEETKSYVHGKIQDLAKYYEEYQKAEMAHEKEIIANLVKMRFAEFDVDNIKNAQLRRFLVNVRGY